MMNTPLPFSIPGQNNHRIVHHAVQPDIARLEELTADAIARLRAVSEAAPKLPPADRSALRDPLRKLTGFALRAEVLSVSVQTAAAELIDALEGRMATAKDTETLSEMHNNLQLAMKLGQRVSDLILAQHQIEMLRINLMAGAAEDEEPAA